MDLSLVSEAAQMAIGGILGDPFLADRVVTIDYCAQEFRLS